MIVLICGDRFWSDRQAIRRRLAQLPKDTIILHGAASGADTIAGEEATKLGLTVKQFPANWNKHGRAAGPIRNRQMLDHKPNLVIAFHNDLSKSKGTKDTVQEAIKRGIPTYVVGQI